MYGRRFPYKWNFYPRSPCGERPIPHAPFSDFENISIHALLAESDCQWRRSVKLFRQFLSTLSLRRATSSCAGRLQIVHNFYPRSPCGERQQDKRHQHHERGFLSTLSLRRATSLARYHAVGILFLSTLSLRRATLPICRYGDPLIFLSTLSLRRATRCLKNDLQYT